MRLGWPHLLVLLVIGGLAFVIRLPPGVTRPTLQMVRGEVQRVRAAGWPLELIAMDGTEDELRTEAAKLTAGADRRSSYMLFSEEAVVFAPSRDFIALPRSSRREDYATWLQVPMVLKDLDGSLRMITWVYLASLMDAKMIEALPPPAPVPYAGVPNAMESAGGSYDWGLPLALLVAVITGTLQTRSRATSATDKQPQLAKAGPGEEVGAQEAK